MTPDQRRGRILSSSARGGLTTHASRPARLSGSAYLDHLALRDGWRHRFAGFTQGLDCRVMPSLMSFSTSLRVSATATQPGRSGTYAPELVLPFQTTTNHSTPPLL